MFEIERGKKKRIRRFGNRNLKSSQKGVQSCRIALIVWIGTFLLFITAVSSYGKSGAIIGSIGFIMAIGAWTGLLIGIRGLKERDKNYRSCHVGIVCNVILLLFYILIFFRGLM